MSVPQEKPRARRYVVTIRTSPFPLQTRDVPVPVRAYTAEDATYQVRIMAPGGTIVGVAPDESEPDA